MSERAEKSILDAAEAYRLVDEVNLLRARAETAEAQLAAVTAELTVSTARHQKDVMIADTIIKANAEDYADLEDERDSLREQMAAGAERVALLEAALTKLNEIRDLAVRTQRVTWSSLVYPLVAVLDEAGFKTTVTDEELDRLWGDEEPA